MRSHIVLVCALAVGLLGVSAAKSVDDHVDREKRQTQSVTCDQQYYASQGQIDSNICSRAGANGQYYDNAYYRFRIWTSGEATYCSQVQVQTNIQVLDIESPDQIGSNCPWDYVEVAGSSSRSCGTNKWVNSTYSVSWGSSLEIRFISDSSVSRRGFIIYYSIRNPCSGYSSSPAYLSPSASYGYSSTYYPSSSSSYYYPSSSSSYYYPTSSSSYYYPSSSSSYYYPTSSSSYYYPSSSSSYYYPSSSSSYYPYYYNTTTYPYYYNTTSYPYYYNTTSYPYYYNTTSYPYYYNTTSYPYYYNTTSYPYYYYNTTSYPYYYNTTSYPYYYNTTSYPYYYNTTSYPYYYYNTTSYPYYYYNTTSYPYYYNTTSYPYYYNTTSYPYYYNSTGSFGYGPNYNYEAISRLRIALESLSANAVALFSQLNSIQANIQLALYNLNLIDTMGGK